MKVQSSVLGYPRMGPARELKKALERYWSSQSDEGALLEEAARIRALHWKEQAGAGIDIIPSGDFSFYDHMLDTAAMLGAVPERYGAGDGPVTLPAYFAMARGSQAGGRDLPALEMTKWFDTNYHYIVPELAPRQSFRLSFTKVLDHFAEARAQGFRTRPVLPGPVTFLSLAKTVGEKTDPLAFLDGVLPVYEEVLKRLKELGADWVQIDEPILVTDMSEPQRRALQKSCARLAAASQLSIMLATYFGGLRNNLDMALALPVAGLHLDMTRGPEQAEEVLRRRPKNMVISLGLVDGRNIWRADLDSGCDHRGEVRRRPGSGSRDRGLLLFPPALPGRPFEGNGSRRRPQELARVLPPEAGRARADLTGGEQRSGEHCRRAGGKRADSRRACRLPADGEHQGPGADGGVHPRHGAARHGARRAEEAPGRGAAHAPVPHHHHRIVPPDARRFETRAPSFGAAP